MNPQKMRYLEKFDNYFDSLKVGKSAIVDSWFMMSSPIPIISVVLAYLLFIRIGPRLMKNRSPLKMNKLLAYYNAFQVILAATICIKVFQLNIFIDGILFAGCRYPSHTQNPMLLDVGWWYFFAKFTELLDTVFFVLRKKEKQISFLHVYHHVIMALYSWSYLKFAAGGEGAILALLNSIVHVFMYTYYLLSGLGPRFQKYLWWKKYVTKMQLTQFILMLLYCGWTHFSPRCQYAAGFTYFIAGNVTIFLFLFLNFYAKSYTKKKDVEKEINDEYAKTQNEAKKNGVSKQNGVANGKCQKENNGLCCGDCNSIPSYKETVAYKNGGGDISNDTDVLLTRRTNKTTFAPEIDFDSRIQK